MNDALQKIIGSEPLRKRGFLPSLNDSEVYASEAIFACIKIGFEKVADQISDAILDELLLFDAKARVACETL